MPRTPLADAKRILKRRQRIARLRAELYSKSLRHVAEQEMVVAKLEEEKRNNKNDSRQS